VLTGTPGLSAEHLPHSPGSTGTVVRNPHTGVVDAFARLQLRELVTELLTRPQLEPAGRPRRLTSNFINEITALPVRW
jgi:hypothetical protein